MEGFERLTVYQKSYRLVLEVYEMTRIFPREEMYSHTDQIRRAASSIPMNIAEGYAKRESQSEFKRFLMMSFGSYAEMIVLLDLSKDLGYVSEANYEEIKTRYVEVGKMLSVLIKRVGEQI